MLTNKKVVKSGNILEIYEFEKAVDYGVREKGWNERYDTERNYCMSIEKIQKMRLESRQRSAQHSKSVLKQIINANSGQWKDGGGKLFMPIFLTLTFGKDITTGDKIDVQKCNRLFSKFKQRLDYEITKTKGSYLKYVAVIEFQKDTDFYGKKKKFGGRVHYHILIFNLPFMENIYDKMNKIWGEGFIIVKPIDQVKNIASYVCKYMTKSRADERLCREKIYFTSRGLKKPKKTFDEDIIDLILQSIPSSIEPYEREIENEACKKIIYRRYDLAQYKEEQKEIDELLDISND